MSYKQVVPTKKYKNMISYKPRCKQYYNYPSGGIIFTENNSYGTCSANSASPYNPPYDFICDSSGENCRSYNRKSLVYKNINEFCCNAGNENIIPTPQPRPRPRPRPRPHPCCNMDLNSCAKCLTRKGVVSSSNEAANHFMNMQRCKNMCGKY